MVQSFLKTTTTKSNPLDGSSGTDPNRTVSDFLTVQSFTNFAAMTGAITAAWNALQKVAPSTSTLWVPYILAMVFGIISVAISLDGLKNGGKLNGGALAASIFIALINSLVLAGAVVGTGFATPLHP